MSTSFIVERRVTYAGFGTRELVVAGAGPTIVLVHGFANTSEIWRRVLDSMHQAGQSAVAVDLPGFGEADPLRPGELMPQLDSFLGAVIQHHGRSDAVVLVGNSLGAATALRACRNSELPITAVLALDTAGITWKPLVSAGLRPLIAAIGLAARIRMPRAVHRVLVERALSHLLYGRRSAIEPAVIRQLADGADDPIEARRLARQGAEFKRELDRTRNHGGVAVPMVVVHGARDRLVPVSTSRILRDANPGSRLVVLPHAGHCPQLDAATVIARLAREFATMSTDTKEIS
ncbi:alpha/beta hydrolase [Nocardia uniformis]|uniref:Alpha/beta hydrolase n=1 Tax=Nocardia uniformis TaxID=53432 RepID=A0A849BXC9_9NOCA|nr:alpha/beta hydrolase [Nocardia uniformis]NNH71192.1 alpha/beta hydrolase [Nocardia uniformis]